MSIEIIKIDLGVNYIEYCINLIKNLDKRLLFINANKRPIRFIEKGLNANDFLKVDFFTIEEFAKYLNFKFLQNPPKIHSFLERELFFLNILKTRLPILFEKLGNSSESVFVWAKRLSNLFDEFDRELTKEKIENFQYLEVIEPAREILENLKTLYLYYDEHYPYGYGGRFFKKAVEITDTEEFKDKFANVDFIFSGLIFLSKSEEEIIKNIGNKCNVKILIQTDLYKRDGFLVNSKYYDFDTFNPTEKLIKRFNDVNISIKEIKQDKKDTGIEFFNLPSSHNEAAFIKNKIDKISKTLKDKTDPANIAVILPSSPTLTPLMAYLNKNQKQNLNITMGYPFAQTDFGIFLEQLMLVIIEIDRQNKESGKYLCSSKLLYRLLNSNIFNLTIYFEEIEELKNKLLTTQSSIYEFDNKELFFHKFIKPFIEATDFQTLFNAFINLFDLFDKNALKKQSNIFNAQTIQYFYQEVVNPLDALDNNITLNSVFIYKLIKECISKLSIPFEGHPLKGVQVMGMLEARLLSFKYIFIADVNEGILPSVDKIDPLMPEEIKISLNLPSSREKEMLMRYNFFRLIFSSNNAFILYKSSAKGDEKNIRSRFVEQLILLREAKQKRDIDINTFDTVLPKLEKQECRIEKNIETKQAIDKLLSKCVSPSLLNDYLSCPYKFYLKRIKKIQQSASLEKDFEANTIGSIIHYLFEKNFKKFVGKRIYKDLYKTIKRNMLYDIDNLEGVLADAPSDNLKSAYEYINKISGFQLRAFKLIAKHRVKSFFECDKVTDEFKLNSVEKKIKSKEFNICGIADRIDELDKKIRIIDYKTGTHTPFVKKQKIKEIFNGKKLIFKEYDEKSLKEIYDIVGSIQLPAYLIMAKETFGKHTTDKQVDEEISFEAAIYQISKSCDNIKQTLEGNQIDKFKTIISYIIQHMKQSQYIFANPDEHCSFCEYATFCRFSK